MRKITILLFICATLLLPGCKSQEEFNKTELTISAAASLQEALVEVGNDYMTENPEVSLIYNFAGSGSLQQQISHGAPVDIFISAAEMQYNQLLERNLIDRKQSVKLLGNELVLIKKKDSNHIHSLDSLVRADVKRIAIGTPESVPAGHYAKQALSSAGIWEELQTKIVPTKDVRQVLSYVETGSADAGIAYKTDALISDKITMISLSEGHHDSIIYPAGIVSATKHAKEAHDFFIYLQDEKTLDIFKKYGFSAALD